MNKKKIILLGADILLLAVLIFLDQLTKHFAVVYLCLLYTSDAADDV